MTTDQLCSGKINVSWTRTYVMTRVWSQCCSTEVTGEGEETPNALRYFWRLPRNNRGGLVCKLVLRSFIQENKYIQVNSIASHMSQRHCIHRRTWLSSQCSNRAQLCGGLRSPTPLPCSSQKQETPPCGHGHTPAWSSEVVPPQPAMNCYAMNRSKSLWSDHHL